MKNTALLLIDFQNDYFSSFNGAKWKLNNTEEAAKNAFKLLTKFRKENMSIIHVHHEFLSSDAPFFLKDSNGAKIHETLSPKEGEYQILKSDINSFKNTKLKETLDELKIQNLLIVGAMSHMCVDAVSRAASDYDYNCFIAHDACATLDLEFNGINVPSEMVHASFMSALQFGYAKVKSTNSLLKIL